MTNRNTRTTNASAAAYETALKPYGAPGEVLALVRMGNALHAHGERLTNLSWAVGKLADLAGEFNDATHNADCPGYVNSGSLGALLVGIEAAADTIRNVLDTTLAIGDLSEIGREDAA